MRRGLNHRIGCAALLAAMVQAPMQVAPVYAKGPAAEAQAADNAEPAGYRETVAEAVREFAAHNFEESRSLFARAHTLYPNARTHRGLGLTEFELRNYGESIAQLEAALRSSVKPLSDDLRADTERMLARANSFMVRVRVDAKPSAAKAVVDGMPVELTAGEPLLLQVGEHVLELQAPGFASEKRKLSVKGGEERTLTVVLSPSQVADATPAETKRAWYKSPWLWGSVGVLVAGAAAGGVGYALTRPEKTPSPYGGTADLALKGP